MANENKNDSEKPEAQIFRKPIQDKATRKVAALPELLRKSERPDGMKAAKVAEESEAVAPAESEVKDGGLFDELFDDLFDED